MCVCHACDTIMPCASYLRQGLPMLLTFVLCGTKYFWSARLTNNNNNTHCCVFAPQAEVFFKKKMHANQKEFHNANDFINKSPDQNCRAQATIEGPWTEVVFKKRCAHIKRADTAKECATSKGAVQYT